MRARPRGDAARHTATILRLLLESPRTPGVLAETLRCSRRSIDRALRGIEAAGWTVSVEQRGKERWYSVAAPSSF